MAENPEKIGGLEGPKEGGELLSLLLRFGSMPASSAAKDLGVDAVTIRQWGRALSAEGWIKPLDALLSDPILSLSPDYEKKISKVRETLRRPADVKAVNNGFKKPKPAVSGLFAYDMIVLVSIALSVYLILKFVRNPSVGPASPILGVVLFFIAILVLRSYRRVYTAKKETGKSPALLALFKEILTRRKRHILVVALLLLVMFFIGKFIVSKDQINLLLLIMPLSSIPLVFLRRVNVGFLIRYYLGMILLMYAILLFAGLYSVSEKVLGRTSWVFDVLVSFLILVLIQLFEKFFGVGMSFIFELAKMQNKARSK